jgi:hypothetical protein
MENKERAQLEVQHQKKFESLKKEVAMLTSLFKQALGYKSGEATFTTQPPHMSTTPFNP